MYRTQKTDYGPSLFGRFFYTVINRFTQCEDLGVVFLQHDIKYSDVHALYQCLYKA